MTDQVIAGLIAAAKARDAGAVGAAVDVLDPARHDDFSLLVAGIETKENGFGELSERILRGLTRKSPDYALGWYELGVLYRWSGRLAEALHPLSEARRCAPDDYRVNAMLAHLLYAEGRYAEADAILATVKPISDEEAAYVEPLREFGRYLQDFPLSRARELLGSVERQYDWVTTDRVAQEIGRAIDERRGFSLVRLGDGEGAHARIDAIDEARFAHLYRHIRADWAAALFGGNFDPVKTGYSSVVSTLMDVSMEADVVGVPYMSWVEHEYNISSLRGVPCLLNAHRYLLANPPAKKPLICNQIIHIDLFSRGFIEPIMRKAKSLSLISCLSGLPEVVKSNFGLDEVDLYKIPGEKYSEHLRSAESMEGVHFPYVYWDITRRLSKPLHGRVFLIAAGTLAKFYAATIKRNGGIALDLGSLVDGWMKIASRPGYDATMAL